MRMHRALLAHAWPWIAGLCLLLLQMPMHAAERVALVIGNSAYGESPLPNPKNDARAMAELLQRAGFEVDLRVDTSRVELLQAIGRFGQGIKDPTVRFAVFYYAGHGFQQDWRNHLVPVDARVRSAADVPRQTVEVSELLRHMNEARGRNFLVILDACRDDPFAGSYRPPAKGLSQFDAPVGSVLAYATAPGRVALDGDSGGNGLYTKHLVRELAVPDASLEDAFKRVRLNVRIESHGRQVPWEMASLEDNVFMFPQRRRAMSDRELEERFERELTAWNSVRQANSIAGLVEFIRNYPTGNTSELAQARLNRLLAEEFRKDEDARRAKAQDLAAAQLAQRLHAQGQAGASSAPVVPPVAQRDRPTPAPMEAPREALASFEAPTIASLPPTPYFSGQVEHSRQYRLGDVYDFRVIDQFTKASRPLTLRVTALDAAADRVEFNGGDFVSDLMGNTLANQRGAMSTPRQFYPAELVVGKKWHTEFRQSRPNGQRYTFRYELRVAGKERLTVPAGTFDTYRIEAQGFNVELGAAIRRTIWVSPEVPADVAHETLVRLRSGQIEQNDRQELVALRR